jgi:hypothetical protein
MVLVRLIQVCERLVIKARYQSGVSLYFLQWESKSDAFSCYLPRFVPAFRLYTHCPLKAWATATAVRIGGLFRGNAMLTSSAADEEVGVR